MVCLDTDFLVALLRGDEVAHEKSTTLEIRGIKKTTTPINAFELFIGAYLSSKREDNINLVKDLLQTIELLEFNIQSCERAGEYEATLRRRGEEIGIRDVMIAAISHIHDETLLTRNTQHYSRIKELKIDKW
jgi:tRNA(fMet)-specific endonuclease VapC